MGLIFVDSKNRDTQIYPSGNSYVLHLTTPIKNVTRVDLVSALVPNTMYNINDGTNLLEVNGTNFSIQEGFYSVYSLADAVSAATSLGVNYEAALGKFTLFGNSQFSFKIATSEGSKLLGLPSGQVINAVAATALDPRYLGKFIIRSTTLVDMSLNEYVMLDIDELRTPTHIDARAIEGTTGTVSGSNATRSFAPIMMDVESGTTKNFQENKDYRVSVRYPEPIGTLQRLTVRWFTSNGQPLNFRGSDTNSFVLRVHVKEDRERPLPPAPPLHDVELRRIIDAMTLAPPPPPPERQKIRWWLVLLAFLGVFVAYKSWPRPSA